MKATPSTPREDIITAGQTGKIADNLSAALRKSELQSASAQRVLEHSGDKMTTELLEIVRKYVEAESRTSVRRIKVDRTRTPQEALDATGRTQFAEGVAGSGRIELGERKVVDSMPSCTDAEVELVFFRLYLQSGSISKDDLVREYKRRGLEAADPISVAALNEADPAFAGEMSSHCTQWKDADDKWCVIISSVFHGEPRIYVRHDDGNWDDRYWFVGVRK